jgi:hypothetical protein
MTDKELLELAAKAIGEKCDQLGANAFGLYKPKEGYMQPYIEWNPITDDGDALRLAVQLNLRLECMTTQTAASTFDRKISEPVDHTVDQGRTRWPFEQCPNAATRRAITRAAAEIGKAK